MILAIKEPIFKRNMYELNHNDEMPNSICSYVGPILPPDMQLGDTEHDVIIANACSNLDVRQANCQSLLVN